MPACVVCVCGKGGRGDASKIIKCRRGSPDVENFSWPSPQNI